mgnify:CR=1 FL=1
MRLKEKLKGTREVLNKIIEKNGEENKGVPIIVEGKKDVKALRSLGAEGKIIRIKRLKTVFHVIEDLRKKYDEVIILTDWDSSGSKLYHKVKKACRANSISNDERLRKELIKYVRSEIKDVESLPKFIQRAERIVSNPYKARNEKRR